MNQQIKIGKAMLCVTRPRRFGKTYAARMLCAYYDCTCDSSSLFHGLKIEKDPSFRNYLNQYHVLFFSVTDFTSQVGHLAIADEGGGVHTAEPSDVLPLLSSTLRTKLLSLYPDAGTEHTPLENILYEIWQASGAQFIVPIDEWDAIFREFPDMTEVQKAWLRLLRVLFKSTSTRAIAAAYMTGVLPIKRYGTQSALTDFREFTMLSPHPIETTFGF